jgi:hypothetical protein
VVVTSAALAPLRWISELMTSVVPWLTKLHLIEAVEDAFDEIAVGRRALGVGDAVVLVVVRNEVGEGTADIDGDGKGHFGIPALRIWPGGAGHRRLILVSIKDADAWHKGRHDAGTGQSVLL